jgi:hypothetical protein
VQDVAQREKGAHPNKRALRHRNNLQRVDLAQFCKSPIEHDTCERARLEVLHHSSTVSDD